WGRWGGGRSRWRRRRWRLPPPNCRLRPALWSASPSNRVMKPADIRAMTIDQIDDEVLKLKKEHFNLRFQRASGQLENTARVREVRRDIARLKTVAQSKRSGKTQAGTASQAAAKPAAAKRAPKRATKS